MAELFGHALGAYLQKEWKTNVEVGKTDVSGNLDQLAKLVMDYAKQNSNTMNPEQKAQLEKDSWGLKLLHNKISKAIKGDYMDPNSQDRIAVLEIVRDEIASGAFESDVVSSLLAQTFIQRA